MTSGAGVVVVEMTAAGAPGPARWAPGTGTTENGGPTTWTCGVPTAGLPRGWLAEICAPGTGTAVNGGVTTSAPAVVDTEVGEKT